MIRQYARVGRVFSANTTTENFENTSDQETIHAMTDYNDFESNH